MHILENALFLNSASGIKSDVIFVFLDPNFLYDAGIPAIREHLRQKPKTAVLGHNRGRGGKTLTIQRIPYFWGLLPLCHFWRKSIKKCDVRVRTPDRQTDTMCRDKLNNFPMLYVCGIAMGQVMKE